MQCWTYIRVAIRDIELQDGQKGVVAIGDTFLFSPFYGSVQKYLSAVDNDPSPSALYAGVIAHCQDSVCVTHAIPTYRCTLGAGIEEKMARKLIALTKSVHMCVFVCIFCLCDNGLATQYMSCSLYT